MMSLKKLIIIKFFTILISIVSFLYLSNTLFSRYENLEKQNTILLEQKTIYERIVKLKPNDSLARQNLYQNIQISDPSLNLNKESKKLTITEGLNIMLVYFMVMYAMFFYLDKKIEVEKVKEPESEREKFL